MCQRKFLQPLQEKVWTIFQKASIIHHSQNAASVIMRHLGKLSQQMEPSATGTAYQEMEMGKTWKWECAISLRLPYRWLQSEYLHCGGGGMSQNNPQQKGYWHSKSCLNSSVSSYAWMSSDSFLPKRVRSVHLIQDWKITSAASYHHGVILNKGHYLWRVRFTRYTMMSQENQGPFGIHM